MGQDKKVIDGALRYIMVRGIGQAFVTSDIPRGVVQSVLQDALKGR
jgi:3-dehydroquinate synthase